MSSSTTDKLQTASSDFPADVFFHILMHIGIEVDDLVWLWTSCRVATRDLKNAVERVFVVRHLKRTFLSVGGGVTNDRTHGKISLATEFSFSHLDPEDRTRAIFRDTEVKAQAKPLVVRHLKSVFEHGNPVAKPKIIVQIRHHANDTPVPGLVPNWDELEMSLNWVEMYSQWFNEESEHDRQMGVFVEESKPKLLEMRSKVDQGQMGEMDVLKATMTIFGDAHKAAWKAIRTERITRNVRAQVQSETKLVDPDTQGFTSLQATRRDISFQDPFSDEETESEEEEDGDEDDVDGDGEDDD